MPLYEEGNTMTLMQRLRELYEDGWPFEDAMDIIERQCRPIWVRWAEQDMRPSNEAELIGDALRYWDEAYTIPR